MSPFSKLVGTGSYLPKRNLVNSDFAKPPYNLETSDEWIVERTGIENRHIAADDETASSMAYEASLKALNTAEMDVSEIEMLIVATLTPDQQMPSTACLLQARLGIQNCIAFDINAACSGYIYAASIADQYIKTGMVKNVLVVGAEVMSRTLDWTDRATCVLFGDGAAATLFVASDQPGIHSSTLQASGIDHELLYAYGKGRDASDPYMHMDGRKVFKKAVVAMGRVIDETLEKNELTASDIDWFIPHQANLRIIKALAKHISLPEEKVIITVQDQSNTSAASIPLALDEGLRSGRIQPGDKVLMEAFGAGLTWGSILLTV